jgi:uncharacterized spore protein YtfJ
MKIDELVGTAQDAITVRKVFGDPYEKDGLTVIPAARVAGGGGGGGGQDDEGQQGEGGGFGMRAHPAGVYVINDGAVKWQPAIDPNRVVLAAAAVVIVALVTRAWANRSRIHTQP